jgi:hypothetical protein
MWRFYAIATVIVCVIGSIIFAHRIATTSWTLRADTKSTRPPASGNGNSGFVTTPSPSFTGQGGWVLSALPSCLIQQSAKEGPSGLLARDIPPQRLRIAPGTTLHRGNCTVVVRTDDIWVTRGRDRLRVPPDAQLYATPEGLTLVYQHGGRTEIRVY